MEGGLKVAEETILNENEVVDAMVKYLKEHENYEIDEKNAVKHTTSHGVDIIAIKNGVTLHVEAKGGTSSIKTSSRYGKPFNRNQVKSHIGQALLATLKSLNSGVSSAIALPDDPVHRDFINSIKTQLKILGVTVYYVANDWNVKEETF